MMKRDWRQILLVVGAFVAVCWVVFVVAAFFVDGAPWERAKQYLFLAGIGLTGAMLVATLLGRVVDWVVHGSGRR